MTFDPYDLASKLIEHGNHWADAKSAADALEEAKKTLLAQLSLKFLADVGKMNKAETMAMASDEYAQHINKMIEARRMANRARVQYDTDQAFIDLVRSQESTRREEMRIR